MRGRGVPIFWHTLAVLIGALVVAQIVSVLTVMYLPAPRPDFYTLSELAEGLVGEPDETSPLATAYRATPPQPGTMIENHAITGRLARMLDRAPGDVRLLFEPDQSEVFPFVRQHGQEAVPIRHGQPYFFNTVEAGVRLPGGGWRMVRTPPRPVLSTWQKRTVIWFGLTVLLMLPIALVFARRMTRPMRRFAQAVERVGQERDAPPVPVEGPAELRITARAVNAMRTNMNAHLRERAAMIGAIAHDLRTPLARIAFRIERVPEDVRGPVLTDIEQMRDMVATTIGFVRDGETSAAAPERRPVDLARLVARLGQQARDTGSSVEVGRLDAVTVAADRAAIERMVQNLIDNAVQYAGAAELSVAADAIFARICVADRGPGIDEATIERMFEPFVRAEPSRSRATGGIGLGLAIARSIATAHGGAIAAANRDGGGLVVTVELPLAA